MSNKSLPGLINKCQHIFNEYIRERDLSGDYFKCISCGQIKPERFMNAGHYYNVGHFPGLRFDEDNCHGQCIRCNKFLHGNLIEYQNNLITKIGIARFQKLKLRAEGYKRTGHKFSRFEVIERIEYFKTKLTQLKQEIA
jgi:hypothetical protein